MSATTLQPRAAVRVPRPAAPIGGAILAKWDSLGGAGGPLGAVQGGDVACPDGVGHFVHFAGGSIYRTPATSAVAVRGPILVKWGRAGGGRCAVLGCPGSDGAGCPDGAGRVGHFQSGSICWTPAAGAFSVHGAIRAKWWSLGRERCAFLGYPVSDETGCPDGVGRFNHFEHGSIYWTPATGAFAVHGAIRDRWASLGRERSALGYPVSDEGDLAGGGRVGTFQHGRICWTAARGAWVEIGAPALPQLDYTVSPVVPDAGGRAGGFAHLTIRQDGSYVFSGHLHGSGATSCGPSLVLVVKDALHRAYTFAHAGSGSRGDDWSVSGADAAISANWASLVGGTGAARAAAGQDIASPGDAVLAALGIVAEVIPVAGMAFGKQGRALPGPAKGRGAL